MGTPENKISDFVEMVRCWISRRGKPTNVSTEFWMPDQSCRVCYECDSQFTVFNRKHHCRLCGRVFCAKCTTNSIPAPSDEPRTRYEDWERIRVCNFCFKQWEQGVAVVDSGNNVGSPGLSPSPSATSLVSTQSGCTCNSGSSTVGSTIPYSTGPYQCLQHGSGVCPRGASPVEEAVIDQNNTRSGRSVDSFADAFCSSQNKFGYETNRSDDEDDDYGVCNSVPDTRHFSHTYGCYGPLTSNECAHMYGPQVLQDRNYTEAKDLSCSPLPESCNILDSDSSKIVKVEAHEHGTHDCDVPSHDMGDANIDPVDFENSGLLWLPPEPEDAEDEREVLLFDDADDDCDDGEGTSGEWGYLHPTNSFGSGEYRSRDKSSEEHKKATKNVVEGHFRALVSQLLLVENISIGDEDVEESWLEIVTSLCWEAATLLKPDTSNSGGMDPGGYVKVKCIACGHRSESLVIKGVVCKKNVAHRRMMSKIDKPRFLLLGGALEYQRVSNHLSSVDTLLQQEMDHLKMAVAKIHSHQPNVLLVEKSVSRYAQEYLLAEGISLVLNIKRPLLERIARCTGAHIVPSIDHLTSQKLGYCNHFHVERCFEEHGSAGQGGKKLTKTLMYFEGCPKPFGCTILLKGANGDELKKVKHVVQYGVFAAYHLALETSFLADEGASLPELPLKSPITVALPHKPSSIDRSISTIPGFTVPASGKPPESQAIDCSPESNYANSICLTEDLSSRIDYMNSTLNSNGPTRLMTSSSSGKEVPGSCQNSNYSYRTEDNVNSKSFDDKQADFEKAGYDEHSASACFGTSVSLGPCSHPSMDVGHNVAQDLSYLRKDVNCHNEELAPLNEEFPPSPSDHQSILVSLSTRCVWKGTVCERARLLRIKYYGSSDKPLGRFLHDHLFDLNYHCRSCEMPSEAHVHCYTHRQGSLTISVKKLPEFLLPGEREGKIWMWHRCLRCPRINGFPPATRRVVMSDAAWGLSFGKFLELSFSNHAAASRAASCGHSLHRDCLRFYGFGRMVACFRYASIDVYSVYLPPPKVEFNYDKQDWIQNEANEVGHLVELLFNEVLDALHRIMEKICGTALQDHDIKAPESLRLHIDELKGILQKEKEKFEESLRKATSKELKVGQPIRDILEINKLRRQIFLHSYVWDQRLIHASNLSKTTIEEGQKNSVAKAKEKRISSVERLNEMDMASKAGKRFSSCDSYLLDTMAGIDLNMRESGLYDQPCAVHEKRETDLDQNMKDQNMKDETEGLLSYSSYISGQTDPLVSGKVRQRVHSEGEFPPLENLSDTLDAAWIGTSSPVSKETCCSGTNSTLVNAAVANGDLGNFVTDKESVHSPLSTAATRVSQVVEKSKSGIGMPFPYFHGTFNINSSLSTHKLDINEYSPVYISLVRELERQSGARLLLPVGINDTVIPVYDDEPTSVIAYALVSTDYHAQMSELGKPGDLAVTFPLLDLSNILSLNSLSDSASGTNKSFGSTDESILSLFGSRGSQILDPLSYTNGVHPRISFTDDGPLGKVKYTVTCYYAKRFEALRRTCCPSELDFIRSLSRCKKWGAQGGKSNVFFAKTLDDRFIIKQVTKTELESFIKFGPAYFKYISEAISSRSPTCLAKILGIYQVLSKNIKGGKESKMDVLVMENLLFRRNIMRLYDLKGSSRSRYNPDTSGSNKVLLDQNLIEAMPTSPIFVGNQAKRWLERAVWNDTQFLASIDVMDYSLLVGLDEEKHELVLGIIDFMRQYTWDKHLETWVKTTGILVRSRNTTPTVISPQQYKKRFRKAMTTYFLMVPDQWSPSIIHSGSQSDVGEESLQHGASVD